MEEQQKNIEEAFRESLSGYREAPPAAAWEAVRARLDADQGRRRRFFAWWVWVSLLLMFVGGTWLVAEQMDGGRKNAAESLRNSTTTSPTFTRKPPVAMQTDVVTRDSDSVKEVDTPANREGRMAPKPGKKDGPASTPVARASASRQSRSRTRAASPKHTRADRAVSNNAASSAAPIASKPSVVADSASEPSAQRRPASSAQASRKSRANRAAKQTPAPIVAQSRPLVADSAKHSRTRGGEEKTRPASVKSMASTRPPRNNVSAYVSAADSSPVKKKASPSRDRKPRQQASQVGVTAPDKKPASTANSGVKDGKPGAAVVKPLADPTRARQPKPDKVAAPKTSIVKNTTASNSSKPAEQKTSAAEGVAAVGLNAATAEKAPTKPANPDRIATEVDRGASGIPVLPNLTTTIDSPETQEPSLPTAGGGGGGADDVEGEEEQSDTLAKPKRKQLTRFSLTPLAGYEIGTQGSAPGRLVGSLRFQWHFSGALSIGIQPAFRSTIIAQQTLIGQQSFQSTSPVQVDSFSVQDTFGPAFRNYYYYISQTSDSIAVPGSTAGGKLWEVELPLMLHYKVPRTGLHFFGGPSLVFGGRLSSSSAGTIQTYSSSRQDSIILFHLLPSSPRPPSDTFTNYFGPPSSLPPYSSYNPAAAQLQHPSATRFGYVVGLGYEWRRITLDVSLHKQLTGYSNVNAVLRDVYASPYVRAGIGYRFGGPKPGLGRRRADASEKYFLQRF